MAGTVYKRSSCF